MRGNPAFSQEGTVPSGRAPKASRSTEHIPHLSAIPSLVDIDSGVYFPHCHIQIANQKQINGGRIDLGLSSEDMSAR